MGSVSTPRLPSNPSTPFERTLIRVLTEILNEHAQAINQFTTGKLAGWSATSDAIPTLPGTPGDVVRNTAVAVEGNEGSYYIVWGWIYGDDDAWHVLSYLTEE